MRKSELKKKILKKKKMYGLVNNYNIINLSVLQLYFPDKKDQGE